MLGIVIAMESEAAPLIDKYALSDREILGKRFYSLDLDGKYAVLAISGIGKVNAAFTTALLLEKYHTDIVINAGVSGGLDTSLRHLDLVAATAAVQHDCDTTAFGDPRGLVSTVNKIYFETDADITELFCSMSGAKRGVVACGDQFVAKKETKDMLKREFNALVCDMESGAVAHCAYMAGARFACLRCVSDVDNDGAVEEYKDFLPKAAEKLCDAIRTVSRRCR